MKYLTRSPSRKEQSQLPRTGRQMLQEKGSGVPGLALKARSIQALFGVILIVMFMTVLIAVFAIGETMSLKVRIGLTFNKPSRLHRPVNLQQEVESNVVDFDNDAEQHRPSNSSTLSVLESKARQKDPDESAEARIDYQIRINDTNTNDLPENDISGEGEQQLDEQMDDTINDDWATSASFQHDDLTRLADPMLESPKLITVDRVQERWLQFPDLYANSDETEQLMLELKLNGTHPCHKVRTKTAEILGLQEKVGNQADDGVIQLHAGPVYELLIVSIGDDDQPRCYGGDYYETDLSGPRWKSRPPVVDLHNGTYAVQLQVDPRFAGRYTFTVVLLFANFHAMHFHPQSYARMEDIATFEIDFLVPDEILIGNSASEDGSNSSNSDTTAAAPYGIDLPICRREDFDKKHWSGRWTREKFNEDCEYDRFGRWQCVDMDLQCQKPWCEGPVGSLESNGWVYSAHCAFKIFREEEAWQCLDGKWLFFWGDSNHIDTIRNLLNFVLGFNHSVRFLDRRMDVTYYSPPDNRSSVRITSMFNGHSNVTLNYEGLHSLQNEEFAAQLRSYFTGETAPDIMIMNSGLHDGLYWRTIDAYLEEGVEYAAQFWSDVWNNMPARRPDLFYRTTVATGGHSRNMSLNPHKMELFNHMMVDKFLKMRLERFQIIDGFDYTFPWHWDHKTNDGVHYGRPPSKSRWAGSNMGHRYFVDLMLVQMLLNAICVQ